MKRLIAIIGLICFIAILLIWFGRAPVSAQVVYQLSCPAGTSTLQPVGQLVNPSNGQLIQWLCIDGSGNVIINASVKSAGLVLTKSNGITTNPDITGNGSKRMVIGQDGFGAFVSPILDSVGGGTFPTCNANAEGTHIIAINCNAACSAGGTCTSGGSTHCELICHTGGSWLETGL